VLILRREFAVGDLAYLVRSSDMASCRESNYDFARATDEALGSVAKALSDLEAQDGSSASLHELSSSLLALLAQVAPSPKIEAAVDSFYEAARRFNADCMQGGIPDPAPHRDLKSGYLRLRTALTTATPGAVRRHAV
jgi:hypothetical protein